MIKHIYIRSFGVMCCFLVLLNTKEVFSQTDRGLLFNEDFDGSTLHPNLVSVPYHRYRPIMPTDGCHGGPGNIILTFNPNFFVGRAACPGVNWINKTDHTQTIPGKVQSGRMLLIDVVAGAAQTTSTTIKKGEFTPVWRSPPIQVKENREYIFEAYAVNVMGSPNSTTRYQPNLQLWVTQLGLPDKLISLLPVSRNLAGQPGTHRLYEGTNGNYEWKRIAGRITSLSTAPATFEIRASTDEVSYNDFALDDISVYSTGVMTNVSVISTDPASGQIFTRWAQPLGGINTLQGPYSYRLYRASGPPSDLRFKQVFATTDTAVTSYTDVNLNTKDSTYFYKAEFYYTNASGKLQLLEKGGEASGVRLSAELYAKELRLRWTYDVPWDNSKRKHVIYREINGVFTAIDSVQAGEGWGQYADRGTFNNQALEIGKRYCYYIETIGTFSNPGLPAVVSNKSQMVCVTYLDIVPPCKPVLALAQLNCDSLEHTAFAAPFNNILNWQPVSGATCDNDSRMYNVYFRSTASSVFEKLTTTANTAYNHNNLPVPSGCYTVTAIDSSGNESEFSNIVCQEACFYLELPNIITPNNDGYNDIFRTRQSAFIRSVWFRVYNRWGMKVYDQIAGPNIDWAGVTDNGSRVADGTYYYVAEVEFSGIDPASSKRTYKGWVEVLR